jgi:MoxR-like ATPase
MTIDTETEAIRYQATKIAKDIANRKFTRKSTQSIKASNYVELVREPEFLDFIKSLQQQVLLEAKKNSNTSIGQAKATVASKVTGISQTKFEPINSEQFKPFKWADYIQLESEFDDIVSIIEDEDQPNILLEADAGVGKTTMAYELGVKFNAKVVAYSCSSGTREGDLRGRTLNTNGLFQLGYLIVAVEIANEEGICILYLDELNALEPELQKMLNSLLDDRRLINANSKMFRINKGCKLIVIATMNPSSYAGTVPLNPDLRSRFCGLILPFPTPEHLTKVVDWTGIPEDVKNSLIQLSTDIFQYKVHGDVDYVVTTRDLKDFCRKYRNFKKRSKTAQECLDKALAFTIYIKFGDKTEKELVEKSANDTFAEQVAGAV